MPSTCILPGLVRSACSSWCACNSKRNGLPFRLEMSSRVKRSTLTLTLTLKAPCNFFLFRRLQISSYQVQPGYQYSCSVCVEGGRSDWG